MRIKLGTLVACVLTLVATAAHAQERTIRGTVTDSVSTQPVSNPNVVVKGTQIGVLGEDDGSFALQGVPAGPVTLVVSRIGYRSTEVRVPAGQNRVTVHLVTDYLHVEELVVTGRATSISRQNAANAIAVVNTQEVNETPAQTVDQALQGKVAGALIESNSGAPGGGLQVKLRGVSSINADASPLYVVDGTLVSNDVIQPDANVITQAAGTGSASSDQDNGVSRIADLNPEDIESIQVLKGASAAAIYGAKASNGVIIITTKRGQAGRPRVRLSGNLGMYATSNELGSRRFTSAAEAATVFGALGDSIFTANNGQFFDNEAALTDVRKPSWQGSGSISGGDDQTKYFGSAMWRNDQGIIEGTGYEKQSARLNLTRDLGDLATVNLNTGYIHSQANRGLTNNDNSSTSYYMVLTATPSFLDLRPTTDSDGNLVFPTNPFVPGSSNPLQTAHLLQKGEDVNRFIGSADVTLNPVRGDRSDVKLVGRAGLDWFGQVDDIFSPPTLFYEPTDGLRGTKVLSKAENQNINLGANAVWTYNSEGGGFTSTLSLGAQFSSRDLHVDRTISQNLTGGLNKVDAGTQVVVNQSRVRVRDAGYYLQEEVQLGERLRLTGAIRGDQSGAAGDPNHVFFYPKASASYVIPDVAGWLDRVKLRAAFGQTGNEPQFGQKFTSLTGTNNIQGAAGLFPSDTVGNPDIKPERQSEFEGGVDLTAFGGRATLEATAYGQWITDLILTRQVAPSVGFNFQLINGGKLRNLGAEVALGLTPVASQDLTWVSRFNFGLNRSKVLELPVPAFDRGGFGAGLGEFRVEQGQSATQIVGTAGGSETVKLGDSSPDFTLSWSNQVNFLNGFRLYAMADWRQGFDVINLTQLLQDGALLSPDYLPSDLSSLRPATECFPNCSGAERLGVLVDPSGNVITGQGLAQGFARPYVQDGSFVKIREVSLSYDLPRSAVTSLFGGAFRSVRLTASGRNLATFTPYSGLDPEVSNFGNQQIGRSIDVSPYPPSRSFWFTVDLGL